MVIIFLFFVLSIVTSVFFVLFQAYLFNVFISRFHFRMQLMILVRAKVPGFLQPWLPTRNSTFYQLKIYFSKVQVLLHLCNIARTEFKQFKSDFIENLLLEFLELKKFTTVKTITIDRIY